MTGSDARPDRYCIIHGHFYQPPRENPWTDRIDPQPSAAPYHDWNERIYDECYRPNAHSRLLNPAGMIHDIRSNYAHMSFNFGPTLFAWLEQEHPRVAQAVIDADHDSCTRLQGHGNAIAQVYNHIILPLASRRDKLTQIRWGKAFFRGRFGREPEGMWLSETAINAETVACLIEEGIRFVVLAPTQAEATRKLGHGGKWEGTDQQGIDTRRAYRINVDGVKGELAAFFFDEGLSREASFGSLLTDAGAFSRALAGCLDADAREPQAAVVATDGETFGHHKPYADMCLAYLFAGAAAQSSLVPVSFGYFLAKLPPAYEVRLKNAQGEGSSWSCAHGTGRWARHCGCQTGGPPEWNQEWRGPLRMALDGLQKRVDARFEQVVGAIVEDPWRLRDEFGGLAGSKTDTHSLGTLLFRHGVDGLTPEQTGLVQRLLAAQSYMLYAYTSCGWFFSDISGIETVQNLHYACRAAQLGLSGPHRTEALNEFLEVLETAKSNLGDQTGRSIFERLVFPNTRNLQAVAFAAATGSEQPEPQDSSLLGYHIAVRPVSGDASVDRDRVVSVCYPRTGEHGTFRVALAHSGTLQVRATVTHADNAIATHETESRVELGLGDLFPESRRRFTAAAIEQMHAGIDGVYRRWMEENAPSLTTLRKLGVPLPVSLLHPAGHAINGDWDRAVSRLETEGEEAKAFETLLPIWNRGQDLGVPIDTSRAHDILDRRLRREIDSLEVSLDEIRCERVRILLNTAERFSVPISRNMIEDAYFRVLKGPLSRLYKEYTSGNAGNVKHLLLCTLALGRRLNFSVDAFPMT